MSPVPCRVRYVVASLAVASVVLMLPGAWGNSVAVTEYAHLPAGLAAWQRRSFSVYRVCGPLSKLLYALPCHVAGIRVDYPASLDKDLADRTEWEVGHVFQSRYRSSYHMIYRICRVLPMVLTIVGGLTIFDWSVRMYGTWPGVASLFIWCLMPPVLAHGSLVTSDMPAAVLLVVSCRCFSSLVVSLRARDALASGLAMGLAQATKFTLLVLYPCWAVIMLCRALSAMYILSGRRAEG